MNNNKHNDLLDHILPFPTGRFGSFSICKNCTIANQDGKPRIKNGTLRCPTIDTGSPVVDTCIKGVALLKRLSSFDIDTFVLLNKAYPPLDLDDVRNRLTKLSLSPWLVQLYADSSYKTPYSELLLCGDKYALEILSVPKDRAKIYNCNCGKYVGVKCLDGTFTVKIICESRPEVSNYRELILAPGEVAVISKSQTMSVVAKDNDAVAVSFHI